MPRLNTLTPWVLAGVLLVRGCASAPAYAQSFYTSPPTTDLGTLFTAPNPGIVRPATGSTIGVAGTVAVSAITGTVAVSAAAALPVSGTVAISGSPAVTPTIPVVSPVDCSKTLTTSGTPVQVLASGTSRVALHVQNVSTGNVGLSLTTASPSIGAAQTFTLAAGGTYDAPPGMSQTAAVWAVGDTASLQLACTYFH